VRPDLCGPDRSAGFWTPSEVVMATGSVSRRRIPSVDPDIEQAANDVIRDPDAYFERQRALCEREAEEYVGRELARAFSLRRRAGVWASLARLSHG
jgi:hypothetical protein